ncbi:MAG: beta-galactosidase [Chloroflexi bacterium]|nr:beta-galactosidase [Chloroflexota bacterium]
MQDTTMFLVFRRLLLVSCLLLLLLAPYRPLVIVGPPQTVQTRNPQIGVHTRLTDEVEERKIKRTLEMVRQMGASWIVEYFPWGYSERKPGRFNWDHADLVVDHARAQGLTVIARLGFVPEWARPEGTFDTYLPEENFDRFGDYVYAFVEHFRGRVAHIIIWNEPNLSLEWGYRPVDPAGYVELLQIAYARAKAADPNVQVLAGALAPTLAPPDSEWGMDDLVFLQRMYDAGAAPYFDVLAAHAYGWKFPPDAPAEADAVNFARTELLREIMLRNGDGHKPVIVTEGGWNDHPRWTKAVRPGQRIAYTLRAYEKAQEEWDWCQAVCLWAFRFPWPTQTYQDYFTFVSADFVPKPLYLEVQQYAREQ